MNLINFRLTRKHHPSGYKYSANYTTYQEKTDVSSDEFEDFRDVISPKKNLSFDTTFSPTPYYQVFSAKHGFLPNLSIVDLIFNMGPESIFVLKDSRSLKNQE